MQPSDPRNQNPAAASEWPGETWAGQRTNENPTLPRMAPVPSPSEAPAADLLPQTVRYGPPDETMLAARPAPQPIQPAQPQPIQPMQPFPPVQAAPQGYPPAGSPRAGAPRAGAPRQPRPAKAASAVDLGAVHSGSWLAGVGGFFMLLGSFLPWITLTATLAGGAQQSHSQSGWDLTAFGRVTALIGLLALALFVVRLLNVQLPFRLPWSDRAIYLALGIEALILGVLYYADNAHSAVNVHGFSVGPAFGLFLTLLGAIVLTIGAYMLGRPDPRAH